MSDRMTIGYLTSVYARAGDTFIRTEVRQLRALGHRVHTFSIRRAGEEAVSEEIRREQASTVYVLDAGPTRLLAAALREAIRSPRRMFKATRLAVHIGTPGLKGRLWPLLYLIEATYLAGRLRAAGVQHLHNHIGDNSAAVALLAALLAGIPHSHTIHGTEFDRAGELALAEKVRRAAFTVAISDYTRSQLYRWTDPRDWPRIHIVHCGLDGSFLGASPEPIPGAPRLVCVGRLSGEKGQLLLIEAAARLRNADIPFELLLVGDGPMRHPLEQLIERHGLQQQVRLAGWAGSEGVRREILAARVLVQPSFAEGLPVVLMEALALGRPVIATYVGGIPELIRPGENGWLVPAGSVAALAEALTEALAAKLDALDRMGRAGAARVAARHDAAAEAGRLLVLMRGVGATFGPREPSDGRKNLSPAGSAATLE